MLGDNPAVFLRCGSLQSLGQSKQDYRSSDAGGEVLGAGSESSLSCSGHESQLGLAGCSQGSHSHCPSGMGAGSLMQSSPRKMPSPECDTCGMEMPSCALSQTQLGQGTGRGAGGGRGVAALPGLPDFLQPGRFEALQTPWGFTVTQLVLTLCLWKCSLMPPADFNALSGFILNPWSAALIHPLSAQLHCSWTSLHCGDCPCPAKPIPPCSYVTTFCSADNSP